MKLRPRLRVLAVVAVVTIMLSSCGGGRPEPVSAERTPGAAERLGCTSEEIAAVDAEVVSAYQVSDGQLEWLCLGSDDPRLSRAWDSLRQVASRQDLTAVDLVAGYESDSSNALALAGPIYGDNERFVIAVLLDAVDEQPGDLTFTMVHELAHVLTQVPAQIDTSTDATDCETFYNGNGCYRPDSYLEEWIEVFWPEEYVDDLPADGRIDQLAGERRCNRDSSFPNAYAATHPDEDFAESFAAYVLGADVPVDVGVRMSFFSRYPEFVAMRQRAEQSGLTGQATTLDPCGV